ncbi:MAG: IS110 family transposase [Lachnospiraceae bacterium]|nr:IS110 family transposase [Lachnospiraceae bacterium]
MVFVGIDVAKDKHDCFIAGPGGKALHSPFTIENNRAGYELLYRSIGAAAGDMSQVKVGLEATGHYSYNILGFLRAQGLATFVINPLHTTLYRKSLSLRKTKTDKVDARTIALMLASDVDLAPYSAASCPREELKSLTRYRFDKVNERAKLKISVARLCAILFPELEKLVPTLHMASVYAMLGEFPGARQVSGAHPAYLAALLFEASKGRYGREEAARFCEAARASVGLEMPAKSLELKLTIEMIRVMNAAISEVEASIKAIMDKIDSPILSIPGISYRMGAMIVAEIGDFKRFDSPDKLLAYAGLSPSTYQSGQLESAHSHMEKRGSRYLRYALFNAAKFVCIWDPVFGAYLAKKRAEGKHYNVAVSHAAKKLVRVMYKLEGTREVYEVRAGSATIEEDVVPEMGMEAECML